MTKLPEYLLISCGDVWCTRLATFKAKRDTRGILLYIMLTFQDQMNLHVCPWPDARHHRPPLKPTCLRIKVTLVKLIVHRRQTFPTLLVFSSHKSHLFCFWHPYGGMLRVFLFMCLLVLALKLELYRCFCWKNTAIFLFLCHLAVLEVCRNFLPTPTW